MRQFAWSLATLHSLCLGVAHAAEPSAPPPVWAFFKNPIIQFPSADFLPEAS